MSGWNSEPAGRKWHLRGELQSWLSGGHQDPKHLTKRLRAIITTFLVIILAMAFFYLVAGVEPLSLNVGFSTASASPFVLMLWLLKRGKPRLTAFLLLIYLYLATTAVAINFDGVYDNSLVVYFLLIAITGLTLGGGAALLSSLASVLAIGVVYIADSQLGGVVAPQQPAHLKVVELGGLYLVMGIVLRLTIADLNNALARARHENAERRAAQQALALARDLLEDQVAARTADLERLNLELNTLIQSSRSGVIFITPRQRLSVINAQAIELLQVHGDVDYWQGRTLAELCGVLDDAQAEFLAIISGQLQATGEDSHAAHEGEVTIGSRVITWSASELSVASEERQLIVLHDATAERDAEQLRHDLVQTMVHDLRNPLSGMLSVLGLLKLLDQHQKEPLSDKQRLYVGRLTASVEQMTVLVNNILDLSRLESGQMPVQHALLSAEDLLTEAARAQLPLASTKGLTLRIVVPTELPPAWGDKLLLARVLQNLVDNAIKFTPPAGDILVCAELSASGDETCNGITVTVQDSGPGISAEMAPRLFQKFSAGNQTGAGSGLGLAFCRLAVEAHGGRLWLDESSSSGATFRFTLPAGACETTAGTRSTTLAGVLPA